MTDVFCMDKLRDLEEVYAITRYIISESVTTKFYCIQLTFILVMAVTVGFLFITTRYPL